MQFSLIFPYIFKYLCLGKVIMQEDSFRSYQKPKTIIFNTFFLILLFFLHSWTGISSFSTKFLILQDIFICIPACIITSFYSTQYTRKVRN